MSDTDSIKTMLHLRISAQAGRSPVDRLSLSYKILLQRKKSPKTIPGPWAGIFSDGKGEKEQVLAWEQEGTSFEVSFRKKWDSSYIKGIEKMFQNRGKRDCLCRHFRIK